jgi:hypothetical protein
MNAEAHELKLDPKTPAEEAEIRESYMWLMRELSHHCDRVLDNFFDHGNTYAIAAEWRRGQHKVRYAYPMEVAEHAHSVNKLIRDNKLTRREVIRAFTRERPSWA